MHGSDSLSHSNGTYPSHKHLFHIGVAWFRHCISVTLHEQELGSSKHMCLLSPSEGMEEMRYDEWAVKRDYWRAYVSHYVLQSVEQCTLVHIPTTLRSRPVYSYACASTRRWRRSLLWPLSRFFQWRPLSRCRVTSLPFPMAPTPRKNLMSTLEK